LRLWTPTILLLCTPVVGHLVILMKNQHFVLLIGNKLMYSLIKEAPNYVIYTSNFIFLKLKNILKNAERSGASSKLYKWKLMIALLLLLLRSVVTDICRITAAIRTGELRAAI
jgi:hypothetical protein